MSAPSTSCHCFRPCSSTPTLLSCHHELHRFRNPLTSHSFLLFPSCSILRLQTLESTHSPAFSQPSCFFGLCISCDLEISSKPSSLAQGAPVSFCCLHLPSQSASVQWVCLFFFSETQDCWTLLESSITWGFRDSYLGSALSSAQQCFTIASSCPLPCSGQSADDLVQWVSVLTVWS